MSRTGPEGRGLQLFTLRQANALLPKVREQLTEVRRCLAALPELEGQGEAHEDGPVPRPVFLAAATLQRAWKEILDSGVQVKDLQAGLLDFPAEFEGEIILLCVRDGEEKIGFWHGINNGFSGRRPVSELDGAVLDEEH